MANTEKPQTLAQTKKEQAGAKILSQEKPKDLQNTPQEKALEKEEKKAEEPQPVEAKTKTLPKTKRTSATVDVKGLHISTKTAIALCNYIRGKTTAKALADLQSVLDMKRAVPMKGEVPHRRGNMGGGRYPQNATRVFISLVKSLQANAADLDAPCISEAVANQGMRPMSRGGIKRKRTHVFLKATEKPKNKKIKHKEKKK